MNELTFQHEQDPLLKEQAVSSIKKTEWLEYLDYRRYQAILTAWLATGLTGVWVLQRLGDLSPGPGIGIYAAILALLLVAPGYFVVLYKLRRRYSLVMNRQYGKSQEVRSSRITKFALLSVAVLVIILLRLTVKSLFPYLMLIFWILTVASQWWGLRKLKKNLRDWGILELEARS